MINRVTTFSSLEIKKWPLGHSFHVNFFLFACFQWRETRCPVSCWLHSKLFVVVHLGCSYLQISSNLKPTFTFLSPRPSVRITVATVKTNLIIIRVMFFGISVHLPANFDGLCPDYAPLTLSSTYFVPKCGARLCHYPGCPAWKQTEAQARYHPQPFARKSILVGTESYLMTLMTGSCNNQR